jgi:hypothetical protein
MITMLVLASLYFLPTLIAAHRGHSVAGVLLLNLLFGWTCIGWIALLLWALASRPRWVYYAAPCGHVVIDRR